MVSDTLENLPAIIDKQWISNSSARWFDTPVKNIFMVLDTLEKLPAIIDQFYVPRFSDLEGDYACQENVENKQLAAFMATTQLLARYSHAKETL